MKVVLCAAIAVAAASSAQADVVFRNVRDNGFFTPFNSSTSSAVRYGDSGWFGSGGDAPVELESITLGLAVYNSSRAGSTDVTFTFNDGDPSGLVFGSGATLYSTTVHGVALDNTGSGGVSFFDLTIALPGVHTSGGFNNIGFSIGVSNFDSDGSMGFQCSSVFGQVAGFYTNNASSTSGGNWSLFSFGGGNFGVANFVATITTPAPGTGMAGAIGLALAARRRRR
jgi:MYXO-CTERM domain-containing protein